MTLPPIDSKLINFQAASVPSTIANRPPTTQQKESFRQTWDSLDLTWRFCRKVMERRFESILLNTNQVDAATKHGCVIGNGVTLAEFYQLAFTIRKLNSQPMADAYTNLPEFKLYGVKIIYTGVNWPHIVVAKKAGDQIQFQTNTADTFSEVNQHFVDNDSDYCTIFTFFYVLDQKLLLFENRGQGESYPRFLPNIYASRAMNNIVLAQFRPFTNAIRFLQLDGIADPTLEEIFAFIEAERLKGR